MSPPRFTHSDLRAILIDRIGLAEADVPDDADTAFADIGLDSLAVVEVQLAVQQRYSFTIPDQDAGLMITIAYAIGYVNDRLATPEVV
jgi:act minimal PKS acyl carrier protein